MSLLLSISVIANGSLADADATPVLSDADETFGVRRVSDGVVVVDAGEELTRQSLGVYTYSFDDAEIGVVYEYSIKAVVGGVTYFKQETAQLADLSASSYLSVSDADTLAAGLALLSAWAAAGGTAKAAALALASERFDLAYRYQGRKWDASGVREFPRIAYDGGRAPGPTYPGQPDALVAATVWDWDADADEAIVPVRVKRAVLYEANSILAADRDRVAAAIHNGLASQSVGSISESYRQMTAGQDTPVLCREADVAARHYRLRSGQLL